jgi:hypothetical protein
MVEAEALANSRLTQCLKGKLFSEVNVKICQNYWHGKATIGEMKARTDDVRAETDEIRAFCRRGHTPNCAE